MLLLMKEKNQKSARKFKTEVKEKVQNDNVKLKSFTDVDIDKRKEPEVTRVNLKLIIWLR